MKYNYLECHADHHDWDDISVLKAPSFGIARDSRCTLCHGIRRVISSRTTGEILTRYYKLPKDYRGPVGTTKSDYRKVWMEQKLKENRKLKSA